MRSSLMRRECIAVDVDVLWPSDKFSNGEMHQSAPSAVALTDEALTVPDENSMPALTHLQGRVGDGGPWLGRVAGAKGTLSDEKDWGAAPAKITRPPWSHSISQSALTVTSATTKGLRSDVKTMGAVEVSPLGGLRQRSVLGPAVRVKYSMHRGSEKVDGRFSAVKDDPSGGIMLGIPGSRQVQRDESHWGSIWGQTVLPRAWVCSRFKPWAGANANIRIASVVERTRQKSRTIINSGGEGIEVCGGR